MTLFQEEEAAVLRTTNAQDHGFFDDVFLSCRMVDSTFITRAWREGRRLAAHSCAPWGAPFRRFLRRSGPSLACFYGVGFLRPLDLRRILALISTGESMPWRIRQSRCIGNLSAMTGPYSMPRTTGGAGSVSGIMPLGRMR